MPALSGPWKAEGPLWCCLDPGMEQEGHRSLWSPLSWLGAKLRPQESLWGCHAACGLSPLCRLGARGQIWTLWEPILPLNILDLAVEPLGGAGLPSTPPARPLDCPAERLAVPPRSLGSVSPPWPPVQKLRPEPGRQGPSTSLGAGKVWSGAACSGSLGPGQSRASPHSLQAQCPSSTMVMISPPGKP